MTDNVNSMASNLTGQVRNIAEVTTAVANGDLSRKITVEVKGEILQLKNTINTMVDQLNLFASEVTRVAREVGTDGKLGGQALVKGVAGVWKDLTDNVNSMASNLTGQVRNIAEVTTAVANGDLSRKITVEVKGEILQLKDTINTMVDRLNSFASEVTRVAREVGTEGNLGGQAVVKGVAGVWEDLTNNVNFMASNLTGQVRNIAEVTTAVANGDLSKKITVAVKGEILQLKNTINTMVDQLNTFASEVTRVAREVGTEGKLGGQAQVKGVAGVWGDLTDNVNSMASNLTSQVRNIAKVVTSVANGNLKSKLALEARGEIATLADTVNAMIDTLATFADQVTNVAREVGVEGKLGGQARVPDASGIWRDLTDNVNQLATNLTTQVRAIADVSTAVTKGDLTRSIAMQAQGEVAALKDNINEMIRNLRETTLKNADQDWLKTNLAKFTRMLQGERNIDNVSSQILSELAPLVGVQHGLFYVYNAADGALPLRLLGSYAHKESPESLLQLALGEGLVGQCAVSKDRIFIKNAPSGYIKIRSGLGNADPVNIAVLPVLFEGEVKAVLELASLEPFSQTHLNFLDQLTESIGIVLNTIGATMRTEGLLKQSQSLTEELQQTNAQLQEKATLLSEQKKEVEAKNREIEVTRQAIEEKAEQLALTSKYKSQFLANMSHELRTPLNSLLILARTLAENAEKNLSAKQVDFAKTIHASGKDLLALINDILDLSKIESGTISLDLGEMNFENLRGYVERNFTQVAREKGLEFSVDCAPGLPQEMYTDLKRLQQVLGNLLSNALKFTEKGHVSLRMEIAAQGWGAEVKTLNRAEGVLAFTVSDTGIGIPFDKQKIIFEAFQQVDMTTSRKYGGTGLGLSISREIARLLGGEIRVRSELDRGSSFTLYLPMNYTPKAVPTEPSRGRGAGAGAGAGVGVGVREANGTVQERKEMVLFSPAIEDDRDSIVLDDRALLIVEQDDASAGILRAAGREAGFKVLAAADGTSALTLAHKYLPRAITLDLHLPDMDGWAVFDRLKNDPSTRHIPIHIVTFEEQSQRGLSQGAFAYLVKPAAKDALAEAMNKLKAYTERPVKKLLVVEDNDVQRKALVELLTLQALSVTTVSTGEETLSALRAEKFDCLVLDLKLPDMTFDELLSRIEKEFSGLGAPIIVYTGEELTKKEERRLRKVVQSIIVKEEGSPERLLDEVSLFTHQIQAELDEPRRKMLQEIHKEQPRLAGKKILIVDDDMRNIFALTSVFERYHMQVVCAENGQKGLDILQTTPDVAVVLMDIMMPDMDGYETMRKIRQIDRLKDLPIVALTARAMRGDREKCIDAGASDYIPKPVDVEQLLSLLRVALYRCV